MKVISVKKGSQAEKNGIIEGDDIISVNGCPVRDFIDFMFYGSENRIELKIRRGSHEFETVLDGCRDHGMEFENMDVKLCGNRCIFCFVDQNPPGMRKEVYLKDEDYRFSFLHGSYVTLTGLRESDFKRIKEQRLSPLYISVHATDPAVRRKLLGLRRDDSLMEKIDRLIGSGIILHCQIVVCPGINDDSVLLQSIHDLRDRFPGIRSVAVVPVGLTKHRDGLYPLRQASVEHARKIITAVDTLHDDFKADIKEGFVYCADEWYIRAGVEIPERDYYDDFPQFENGVGMVRDFLESVSQMKKRFKGFKNNNRKFVLVTGISMSRFIEDFSGKLTEYSGIRTRTFTVKNKFYGDSVTVSGLLTGSDIISSLRGIQPDESVVLPPNCLNESGVFLDDMSPGDISQALGVEVAMGSYDPVETFKGLLEDS
ncbi:DUF512 domain-containing protein [Candidatus Latescibacterota bacterium]